MGRLVGALFFAWAQSRGKPAPTLLVLVLVQAWERACPAMALLD